MAFNLFSIGGLYLLTITIAIFIPFLAAISFRSFIRGFQSQYRVVCHVCSSCFFIYLASFIPAVAGGKTYINTIKWIDSAGINFTTYLDGLSMIFGLLITGVGSLVILYSIYYLSEREALGHFYIYLIVVYGSDAWGCIFR